MQLNIYNISTYYLSDPIVRVSITDLYNKNFPLSPDKQCNNLIQLDQNTLLANCKSNFQTKREPVSLFLEINIEDKKQVKVNYKVNGISFDQMKDGRVELLKRKQDQYYMIVKKNTTDCHLQFVRYTKSNASEASGGGIEFGRRIEFYRDPDSMDLRNESSNPLCVPPERIDMEAEFIDYLQIKDVKRLSEFYEVMVTTDYNYGVIFWVYECGIEGHDPIFEQQLCQEVSLYRIKIPNVGSISILEAKSAKEEQVIFVQVMNPPAIYEINLVMDSRPFISKTYKLPQDRNQYISIDMIGGNHEYIFIRYVSIKNFKPTMRIYKRHASFFSLIHLQIEYDEFLDNGIFYSFIKADENFLLIKTSDYFTIYKLDQVKLIVDAKNTSLIEDLGYINNPMRLEIQAKNYTNSKIKASVDVMFVKRDQMTSYAIYLGSKASNESLGYTIRYSCGRQSAKLFIDYFFSGPVNDVELVSNEKDQDYFQIDQRRIGDNFTLVDYWVKNCNLNVLVTLNEGRQSGKSYLACSQYNGNKIQILDIFSKFTSWEELIKTEFTLPNSRIVELHVDQQEKTLIVVSDQTVEGTNGAVIHFFRLFNVLTWEFSLDLNKAYPKELGNFKFKLHDPISISSTQQLGTIVSEPQRFTNNKTQVTQVLIFDLNNIEHSERFVLKGVINIEVPFNPSNQVNVTQIRFSHDQMIWVLLSNNTFFVYSMSESSVYDFKGTSKTMIKLYRVLEFVETDPALQGYIFNFKIKENKLICFFNNRNIAIYQYETSTLELSQVMILPLYLSSYPNIDYEFIVSSLKQRVLFEIVDKDFLLILYRKTFKNYFDGYTLFIYNIAENRHNSLLGRYDLPGKVDFIDPALVRLHFIEQSYDKLRIIILTEETKLVFFDIVLYTQLVTNPKTIHRLHEQCRVMGKVSLNYTIHPVGAPSEEIKLNIVAENEGLIIYKNQDNENITVSLERTISSKAIVDTSIYSTKYQMLQNFHGYNIFYDLDCKPSYHSQDNICKQIQISQREIDFNRSIEFVSNNNPVMAFLVAEPVLFFFDRLYLRAYYHETQQYESTEAFNIFRSLYASGTEYYTFKFEYGVHDTVQYIIPLNKYYQIGMTKVVSIGNGNTDIINKTSYINFQNKAYVMEVYGFINLPTNISSIDLYCKKRDSFRAVIVFDSPYVTTQSAIQFFDIDINENTQRVTYEEITTMLTATNLNLDSFKISAVKLYKDSPILVLAIENFGIMIYNVKWFEIIQVVSVQSQVPSSRFRVSHIIFHTQINMKLLIPQQGVFTLMFDDYSLKSPPKFKSIFFEPSLPMTVKQVTVSGHSGFSYLELTQDEEGIHSHLRFYSWDSLLNTKSLGTYKVATNQVCRYLNEASYSFVREYFAQDVTFDYQSVALICGSTLKIVSFNFQPSLIINPSNTYQQEINTQAIAVKGHNDFSEETLNMNIVILKQSRAVDTGYYIGFLVVLALMLLFLFRNRKSHAETQIKKADAQSNKRVSNSISQNFNFPKKQSAKHSPMIHQMQHLEEEFKEEKVDKNGKTSVN